MAGSLSPEQIATYNRKGFVFPIQVMSGAAACDRLDMLRAEQARFGENLIENGETLSHLGFDWAAALVRLRRVLDAVESLLGTDIVCLGAQFVIKEPGGSAYVSWHQDAAHWGPVATRMLTAWLALTPSRPDNGCVRAIRASHHTLLEHSDTFWPENMLSRGQTVTTGLDLDGAEDMSLEPGEMSLHHAFTVHGSAPNKAADARVGFAIRYGAADMVPHLDKSWTPMPVRGRSHA